MSEIKLLGDTSVATVINKDAALADGARAAGDYDNSTELDLSCTAYLDASYGTAPSAGTIVAELYLLPGDGAATEVFPEGGDGTVGNAVDPQGGLLVGVFESRNPGTSTNEILALNAIPLSPHTNRFVVKNVAGQQFDADWELRISPEKTQVV